MTQYTQGRAFEYRVRDALRADGYEVIRSAGSKGAVDLVAFKDYHRSSRSDAVYLMPIYHLLFVQAKRRSGTIPEVERAELLRLAFIGRAIPVVAHQPVPRKPIQYRRLTGPGPKDWQPWTPDQVGTP